MAGDKIERNIMLSDEQIDFLEEMAKQYDLPDVDKVLRVLIDYAMEDGDREEIFEQIRCLRC